MGTGQGSELTGQGSELQRDKDPSKIVGAGNPTIYWEQGYRESNYILRTGLSETEQKLGTVQLGSAKIYKEAQIM